jgi:hypothetical protein
MTCTSVVTGQWTSALQATSCAATKDTPAPTETEAPQLLPPPFASLAGSSDLGAQIAALLVCASREQKEAARQSRQAAEKAQCAAEERELDKMGEEADLKLASGIIQGTAQVAAGSMNAGSAWRGDETRQLWSGIAKSTEGDAKLKSAIVDHFAADSAQEAKAAAFEAGHAKTAVDDARDLDKDAKEMMSRALSYYKEYLTAKADTQRATLLKA